MAQKHNKKLPKDGVSDNKIEPKYGYVHGEADACGGTSLVYRNPAEHKKTWSVRLSPTCNYEHIEGDEEDTELRSNLNTGHVRKYTVKGHSEQFDTQRDIGVEKTNLVQAGGDGGCVIKGDRYQATGGNVLKGNGAGAQFEGVMGSSDSKKYGLVIGDKVEKSTGHHHSNREGDEVKSITGSNLTMIKEGDYGVNVQGGSWDNVISDKSRIKTGKSMILQTGSKDVKPSDSPDISMYSAAKTNMTSTDEMAVASGKDMSIASQQKMNQSAKSDITIESDTKITLKVGSNSIEISKQGIKINGKTVDIKADGEVTTKGSSTKIQGGGMTAPPTTFN